MVSSSSKGKAMCRCINCNSFPNNMIKWHLRQWHNFWKNFILGIWKVWQLSVKKKWLLLMLIVKKEPLLFQCQDSYRVELQSAPVISILQADVFTNTSCYKCAVIQCNPVFVKHMLFFLISILVETAVAFLIIYLLKYYSQSNTCVQNSRCFSFSLGHKYVSDNLQTLQSHFLLMCFLSVTETWNYIWQ